MKDANEPGNNDGNRIEGERDSDRRSNQNSNSYSIVADDRNEKDSANGNQSDNKYISTKRKAGERRQEERDLNVTDLETEMETNQDNKTDDSIEMDRNNKKSKVGNISNSCEQIDINDYSIIPGPEENLGTILQNHDVMTPPPLQRTEQHPDPTSTPNQKKDPNQIHQKKQNRIPENVTPINDKREKETQQQKTDTQLQQQKREDPPTQEQDPSSTKIKIDPPPTQQRKDPPTQQQQKKDPPSPKQKTPQKQKKEPPQKEKTDPPTLQQKKEPPPNKPARRRYEPNIDNIKRIVEDRQKRRTDNSNE
ncbi:hypothetical protein LOTGIDRAFT_176525 [Lottia gigantea]|uniref:Uncharacterized protein n=1 Tax=Lottia gigantea TaxID=225164 RepID=V4C8P1_LOTGI|nr:hypothetical protein LOTGIDRAFT_176525 [Lottia gigantea]ESO98114.1 hypothetical protein LOTGIDRAFT_176525 [Lottia gigantea]